MEPVFRAREPPLATAAAGFPNARMIRVVVISMAINDQGCGDKYDHAGVVTGLGLELGLGLGFGLELGLVFGLEFGLGLGLGFWLESGVEAGLGLGLETGLGSGFDFYFTVLVS